MSNLLPPGPPAPGPPNLPLSRPSDPPQSGSFSQCFKQYQNQEIATKPPPLMQQQRPLDRANPSPWKRQLSPWVQAPYPAAPAGSNFHLDCDQELRPVQKKRTRVRPKHKKNKLSDSFVLAPSEVPSWASDEISTPTDTDRLPEGNGGPPESDDCDQSKGSSAVCPSLMSSQQNGSNDAAKSDVPCTNTVDHGASRSEDFASYVNTKDFSDITFVTDADREFYAHKIILAARSQFFAKTFKEKLDTESGIEITDVKGDIFEQVLNSIYTGAASISDDNVNELCVAAEKFALHSLKRQCTKYLLQNLNTDNAAKLLAMSSDNNMLELKEKCISYISAHPYRVTETEEYKELVATHPTLLDELYRDLVPLVDPLHPKHSSLQQFN